MNLALMLLLVAAILDRSIASPPPPSPTPPPTTLSPCCTSVVVASCFGFDANDSTTFLQAALSCPLARIVKIDLPPGGIWNVQPLLINRSNVQVLIESGTTLRAVRGAFHPTGACLMVRVKVGV